MFNSIKLALAMLLIIFLLTPIQAQTEDIDPVTVSPDMYRLLLENEHVRVVEYLINPGKKDNWHTHPAKVSYVVSGGALKITTADGESFIVEETAGASTWFGAVGKHYGENVGKTPVRIVFVEIKGIEVAREDLKKYRKGENQQ